MNNIDWIAVLTSAAFIGVAAVAGLVVVGIMFSTHSISRRFDDGVMWAGVAILLMGGATFLDLLTSPGVNVRSLGMGDGHLWGPAIWLKRLALAGVMLVTLVRALRGISRNELKFDLFFAALLVYWLTNYALNAVGGTDQAMVPSSLYALSLMFCVYASGPNAAEGFERGLKLIIVIVLLASLAAAPVAPLYTIMRGNTTLLSFLGGRLNGVTGHPNTLAQVALIGIVILAFGTPRARSGWLNWPLIVLSVIDLFLSQSKTAIIAVGLLLVMKALQFGAGRFDLLRKRNGTILMAVVLIAIAVLGIVLQMADVFAHLYAKLQEKVPALSTLTGRTEIWRLTYDEFVRNPLFGYGPGLWDINFRLTNGLMEVGHAHNQFMQTLGSSGLFGVAGLFFYVGALVRCAWRAMRRHGNWLPLAGFVVLAILSIAEAPLRLSHPMDIGALLQLMIWLSLHSMNVKAERAQPAAAVPAPARGPGRVAAAAR